MASPYLALWNRLSYASTRAFREAMMCAPCCERPTPLSFKPSATDVTESAGRFYTPPCNATV